MAASAFANPFRPGAGHRPPWLAGRKLEQAEFRRLLEQTTAPDNLVLSGLRGDGKTVLLDKFKPIALQENWLWVGTDLSEAASISETNLAERLITDLSVVTGTIKIGERERQAWGFTAARGREVVTLGYELLSGVFA